MPKFRKNIYDYSLQVGNMKSKFPQFTYTEKSHGYDFIGILQPEQTPYTVKIEYRKSNDPKVFIISPDIMPNKHLYSDNSLCIYKKSEMKWHERKLLTTYVVPLTCMWLKFYELFLLTGKWYGPEAPHDEAE